MLLLPHQLRSLHHHSKLRFVLSLSVDWSLAFAPFDQWEATFRPTMVFSKETAFRSILRNATKRHWYWPHPMQLLHTSLHIDQSSIDQSLWQLMQPNCFRIDQYFQINIEIVYLHSHNTASSFAIWQENLEKSGKTFLKRLKIADKIFRIENVMFEQIVPYNLCRNGCNTNNGCYGYLPVLESK